MGVEVTNSNYISILIYRIIIIWNWTTFLRPQLCLKWMMWLRHLFMNDIWSVHIIYLSFSSHEVCILSSNIKASNNMKLLMRCSCEICVFLYVYSSTFMLSFQSLYYCKELKCSYYEWSWNEIALFRFKSNMNVNNISNVLIS